MAPPPTARSHPLVVKLASITDLSGPERQALLGLTMRVQDLRADQDIVREGDRPSHCCLVLDGFACRFKFTDSGKRQIFAFHLPGDIPDLQTLHLRTLDHTLGTLMPCRLGFIHHDHLRGLLRDHPRLAGVFWRDTLIDASIFREWMLGLGRHSAKVRLAHLLCEMVLRLRAIGQSEGDAVRLPITQSELGDALGLSAVHVNRTLQDLRQEELLSWDNGILRVLNWDRLTQVGEFHARYLHQEHDRAGADPAPADCIRAGEGRQAAGDAAGLDR